MALTTIVIIAGMLLINSVFAAYEIALASVSLSRLAALSEQGRPGAGAALFMKSRMEASLAVVQLGITLVGAIAAAVGGAGAEMQFSPWLKSTLGITEGFADFLALALVVLPISGVTIVCAELVPKSFALKNAELVCLTLSQPMRFFARAAYPIVFSLEWLTKWAVRLIQRIVGTTSSDDGIGGLHAFLAHAEALRMSRILSPQQERVIMGVGRLSKLTVRDILVPSAEIKLIHADGSLMAALVRAHVDAHTRFLVTDRADDPQSIIGYVNVKDLFFLAKSHPHNPSVREITRQALALPPDLLIGEAFARLMSEHAHLAIVRDAAGVIHGMITLGDILQEVVGDIHDEFDRLPRTLVPAGHSWIAGGGTTLAQVRDALNWLGPVPPCSERTTLNEWIGARIGAPRTGETYSIDGLKVLIRKMRRGNTFEAVLTLEASRP